MTEIGEVRFGGRAKWGAVTGNLVIAALGVFLVVVAFVAVPADVHAIRALGWYSVFGVALTLALAVGLATNRSMPTVGRTTLDGDDAVGLAVWPWEWRYDTVLDLGLGAALVTVAAIGVAAGNGWLVPSILLAVGALWFLVRAGLAVSGRRRNEALWLTRQHLVHDTTNGRERCDRRAVSAARPVGHFVVVDITDPVTQQQVPRPWRRKRRLDDPTTFVFDCRMTGHTPAQLSAWLRGELRLDEPAPRSR